MIKKKEMVTWSLLSFSMFESSIGRGALWAALARSGNGRHAPLLLSLDVSGPNDLALKAPDVLAGGMSQAELEAVLAASTPIVPSRVEGRRDHPTLMETSGRASLTLALAAAQPNQRRAALEALDADMLARTTKPAHESRLRTFMAICSAWEVQAFPLNPECIRCVGASMKAGGYRSVALYFQSAVGHQLRVHGVALSQFLRSMIRDVVRSVRRGLGPGRLKAGFDLSALANVVDNRDDGKFDINRTAHMADLMILCSWFMLRELEISFARAGHLSITGSEIELMVPVHKTNTHGSLTVRTLRCACGIREQPLYVHGMQENATSSDWLDIDTLGGTHISLCFLLRMGKPSQSMSSRSRSAKPFNMQGWPHQSRTLLAASSRSTVDTASVWREPNFLQRQACRLLSSNCWADGHHQRWNAILRQHR